MKFVAFGQLRISQNCPKASNWYTAGYQELIESGQLGSTGIVQKRATRKSRNCPKVGNLEVRKLSESGQLGSTGIV